MPIPGIVHLLKRQLKKTPFLIRLKKRLEFGPSRGKIAEYLAGLEGGSPLRVIFGGHWSDNPGWLILSEKEQDPTGPLHFDDKSVDVIFTEHVFEHLPSTAGVHFIRESFRVLKSGGYFQIGMSDVGYSLNRPAR